MRWPLITISILAACVGEGDHLGPPPAWPLTAPLAPIGSAEQQKRRGQVELVVKSNYEGIKRDIGAGGGPALTKAFDAAGVPVADRPTRTIQLQSDQSLYQTSPSALVTALLLYSS